MWLILLAMMGDPIPLMPDYSTDARWPLVRVGDAAEFGIPHSVCKTMEAIADQHAVHWYQYLQKHYPKLLVDVWETEWVHCMTAWRLMREIQEPGVSKERKLMRLDYLREWIGDEDYNARRMPPPCPGHLFANEEPPRGIE